MSTIIGSFNKLSRVVQVILLLIPGVNFITELVVRISAAMHGKAGLQVVAILLDIITCGLLGWIDLFSVLIQKKLILT